MERAKDNICPRCLGAVPNEKNKGKFMGALSRVADVEICSLCGEDEALAALLTAGKVNGLIPQSEWPIDRAEMETRMELMVRAHDLIADQVNDEESERGLHPLEARMRFE